MNGLAQFLLARIAEDRAVARAAIDKYVASADKDGRWYVTRIPYEGIQVSSTSWGGYGFANADTDHMQRWSPARVLAECDAKQRLVEFYAGLHYSLQFLALAFADHPDYDEEWRP